MHLLVYVFFIFTNFICASQDPPACKDPDRKVSLYAGMLSEDPSSAPSGMSGLVAIQPLSEQRTDSSKEQKLGSGVKKREQESVSQKEADGDPNLSCQACRRCCCELCQCCADCGRGLIDCGRWCLGALQTACGVAIRCCSRG